MKQVFTTIFIMLSISLINAQEFSMFLYFEDNQGNKDSIEVGYDESATTDFDAEWYGKEYSKDEVVDSIQSNRWVWINKKSDADIFYRKAIIIKPTPVQFIWETEENYIRIIIPVSKLPVTITWKKEKLSQSDFPKSCITDATTYDSGYGDENFEWCNSIANIDSLVIPIPSYHYGDSWHSTVVPLTDEIDVKILKFYFANEVTWSLNNVLEEHINQVKFLYNGQIYINYNGNLYNTLGVKIIEHDKIFSVAESK